MKSKEKMTHVPKDALLTTKTYARQSVCARNKTGYGDEKESAEMLERAVV